MTMVTLVLETFNLYSQTSRDPNKRLNTFLRLVLYFKSINSFKCCIYFSYLGISDTKSPHAYLIATGFPFDNGDQYELIDFADISSTCKPIDFPKLPKLWGSVGQVLRNYPVICGGENKSFGEEDICYILDHSKGYLQRFRMRQKRGDASSIKVNKVRLFYCIQSTIKCFITSCSKKLSLQ